MVVELGFCFLLRDVLLVFDDFRSLGSFVRRGSSLILTSPGVSSMLGWWEGELCRLLERKMLILSLELQLWLYVYSSDLFCFSFIYVQLYSKEDTY